MAGDGAHHFVKDKVLTNNMKPRAKQRVVMSFLQSFHLFLGCSILTAEVVPTLAS